MTSKIIATPHAARRADKEETMPARPKRGIRRRSKGISVKKALTRREREILNLLAEGIGTEGICRMIAVSRVTVRNHVQRILGKLGAHSRLEAVARARREGIFDEESGG
jgi:DNA-binding NarL/FixJ family response regulator